MASADPEAPITATLDRLRAGDASAREELVALIYDDLRAGARRLMRRESTGHTLQPTALVNESLLRIMQTATLARIENRRHLIAAATVALKRVLVDHARARAAQKRGGDRQRVGLEGAEHPRSDGATPPPDRELSADPGGYVDELLDWYEQQTLDVVRLDDALGELREIDERWFQIVLLRFFGGLTNEQTAEMLDVSLRTVTQDWSRARAWLKVRLEHELDDDA